MNTNQFSFGDESFDPSLEKYNNLQDHELFSLEESRPYITEGQEEAFKHLEGAWALKLKSPSVNHISVRANPLFCGPSGCGKTATVKMFCHENHIPLLIVMTGSWVLLGAHNYQNCTLREIQKFIRDNSVGIIFVDEIDKIKLEVMDNAGWFNSVFVELFSVLDADEKLLAEGFTKADIEKLKYRFLIVGAGAWQQAFKDLHGTKMGFQNHSQELSLAQFLLKKSGIPDELLFRFNDPVEIKMPSEEDFQECLIGIHKKLNLPLPETEKLFQFGKDGVAARRGVRFIELYLTKLLINNPNLLKNFSPPHVFASTTGSKGGFEFNDLKNEFLDELRDWADQCERLLFELSYLGKSNNSKICDDKDNENEKVLRQLLGTGRTLGIKQHLNELVPAARSFSLSFVQKDSKSHELKLIAAESNVQKCLKDLLHQHPVTIRNLGISDLIVSIIAGYARIMELYRLMMALPM